MITLKERLKQEHFAGPGQEALLHLLVVSVQLHEHIQGICKKFGITMSQFNLLRILRGAHPEGYCRNELIARVIDRAPDITRLLDRLISAGYVHRHQDEGDRRRSVAVITEKGLNLLHNMDEPIKRFHHDFETTVSLADCRELARICTKILNMRMTECPQ